MQSKGSKLLTITAISGIVLISGGLVGCGKMQSSEKLVSEAKEFQQKGDSKAAVIQLKNALQKNPDDPQARYLLGTVYNETGEYQSAEKELGKAVGLGMDPVVVAPGIAKALLNQGKSQQALDETSKVPADKFDAALFALRGNAYLSLGKLAEAKDSFDRALQAQVDYPDALIGLGKHAFAKNDMAAAIRYGERATAAHPDKAETWFFKGELLNAQDKSDDARVAYAEAIKRKPQDTRPYLMKAGLEISAGKFDAAKLDIDAARKSAPGELSGAYMQALLEYNQGKYPAALESVQQVLRVAPDHMPSKLLAGAIQFSLGSTEQAEQHLKKYLEKSPGHLYASRLLASTFLKNKEPQRAIDVLMPALKNAPQDIQLLGLAGESYMQVKDYRKAADYFEKASTLDPQASNVRAALGMSRLAQGENARGIADLEMSADLDPKQSPGGVMLLSTHIRLKEFDKAIAVADKLEKVQPDNPVIQNLKGGAYIGKKDMASARASFEKAVSLQPDFFQAVGNLARLDLMEKKPDAAKKRLEAFLKVDKKSIEAMTALANIANAEGRNQDGTAWLERASNERPDEARPAMLLISQYLDVGEKRKALTLAQKTYVTNPQNPDVLEMLARAQLANDDNPGALQSYNKLAAAFPKSAVAQFRLASVHTQMKNETAAVSALRAALQLKPDYVDAQIALAAGEVRKGNHDSALAIARQIQKQAATSSTGYELEADILVAQKKPDAAVKAYDQALATNKSSPIFVKLYNALTLQGKDAEGNLRLIQWEKENPNDTYVRMYLGTSSLATKNNKAAIEHFENVLKRQPKNAVALNNLALAYQQEKDPRMLEYAEKAHQLASSSPAIMDTLGLILIEQGDTKRGIPLLQKAVSMAPTASDIRYHLALGLAKSGNNAAAKKELAQALSSDKPFSKIEEAKTLQKQLQ